MSLNPFSSMGILAYLVICLREPSLATRAHHCYYIPNNQGWENVLLYSVVDGIDSLVRAFHSYNGVVVRYGDGVELGCC